MFNLLDLLVANLIVSGVDADAPVSLYLDCGNFLSNDCNFPIR